jgi:hypothetical protein
VIGRAAEPIRANLAEDAAMGCRSRIDQVLAKPALPGSPAFDAVRAEVLGRARGEPLVLVQEPAVTPDADLSAAELSSRRAFERSAPGRRIDEITRRHARDPRSLRRLLLREGYVYSADPADALAMVTSLHVANLFDEPEVFLQRGARAHHLVRAPVRRGFEYRHADGPYAGRAAELVFGDRLANVPSDLARPLHRDLRALAVEEGFDRTHVSHRTEGELVVDARFGSTWARLLLEADGAALRIACVAEPAGKREAVAAIRRTGAARARASRLISRAIDAEVDEALRFDRPEGEKTAERDGKLRPVWLDAYRRRQAGFSFDGFSYPVYDARGRPWPPQVCVDFVLDTYERASGTWFSPFDVSPGRVAGRLDFDAAGIPNRRAVLAFERFADEHPDLFELRRFRGAERIPFGERTRFFEFLVEHADEVRPGDVVAIQGRKRDGLVHQHAIFVEGADPVTGFAHALADQMKRPRRRTWEGIMAEAPLRSLLFRARPRDAVLETIAGP